MTNNVFSLGGVEFTLADDDRNLVPSSMSLPATFVAGLSAMTYSMPDQKQSVLDALSPFQLASKLWSTLLSCDMLGTLSCFKKMTVVFPGGWYGQQSALMCRRSTNYRYSKKFIVDKDEASMNAFNILIGCDPYHESVKPTYVNEDFFVWASKLNETDTYGMNQMYLWNGLEHFDPLQAKDFIRSKPSATFVLQSTNMKHEDHTALCETIEDLLNYVPKDRQVIYSGELSCNTGSRYMVAF